MDRTGFDRPILKFERPTPWAWRHHAARRLKQRLERDERWKLFCHQAGQAKFQTAHRELAFLMPPRQRSQARFMNIDPLLSWANRTLATLEQ